MTNSLLRSSLMKTNRLTALLLAALFCNTSTDRAAGDTFGNGANSFVIEFVTIGDSGNPPDTIEYYPSPSGSVAETYRIGKYEISEEMINKANAQSATGGDPLDITHNGRGPNLPATTVSWFEAARFVNWLNTSTGSTPAYKFDLIGDFQFWQPGDAGYNPNNLFRNSLARYFLPSADEWYKAAYYDPIAEVYYDYPTGSDSVPDGIDFVGDTNFEAVFFDGGSNPQPNEITDVGDLSPYGTAGQGGNAWEWEESSFDLGNNGSSQMLGRGVQGGYWYSSYHQMTSIERTEVRPDLESVIDVIGFRVASIPEPSSLLLLLGWITGVGRMWRRRTSR